MTIPIFQFPGLLVSSDKVTEVKIMPLSPDYFWNFWEWTPVERSREVDRLRIPGGAADAALPDRHRIDCGCRGDPAAPTVMSIRRTLIRMADA